MQRKQLIESKQSLEWEKYLQTYIYNICIYNIQRERKREVERYGIKKILAHDWWKNNITGPLKY